MTVTISVSATLNTSTNNFVVAWYAASAPSVLINSVAPTKPYGNPFQVPMTGLIAGQTYIIKLWESTTTSPTGTVRNSMSMTPQATTTATRFPDYLIVDITAGLVSGATSYVNLTYAGWGYTVEEPGNGTMFPVGSPDPNPRYDQDVTGGWHLVQTGETFQPEQKFVVHFIPQVAPAPAAVVGIVTSSITLTAATTMDNTYVNTAVYLRGSGSSLPIILPPLSSIQNFQFLYIYSAGGNHVSAPITVGAAGDRIQRNTQVTKVILNQNECLKIFKDGGVWNVDYISPTVDMVGEIIYKPTNTDFNYLFGDGSLVSRTVYARLYDFLNTKWAAGAITETAWAQINTFDARQYNLNKGFWTQGTDGTNFRLPLLTGKFIRSVDGSSRLSGSGEVDAQIQHSHDGFIGLITGAPNGKGPTKTGGKYGGSASSQTDLSSGMYNIPGANNNGVALQRQDVEVRPVNTGEYAIIRL